MKFEKNDPAREYTVGAKQNVVIKDCGSVYLQSDEQITLKTESNTEYDITKKSWGYYATPSLNKRLINFNLRPVLVKNINTDNYYVLLVEKDKENDFKSYLTQEHLKIILRLDVTDDLKKYEEVVAK